MNKSITAIQLAILALIAGCAQTPVKPVLLRVPQTVYVPIPDALTAPCPIVEPQNYTVAEAVRIARERKASLQKCNDDKTAIRGIQGAKQ